jgi:Fe-S cluster biogenesis protein NfuA
LAIKLFHFPFVKEVFISSNFVAVQKYNVVEWETVTQEIRQLVLDFLQSGQPVMESNQHHEVEKSSDKITAEENLTELSEIEERIVDLLEEYVKPAVQQDGGNISFVSYENKVVKVQLQGACSGCPSSTLTLQSGIKSILQRMLPTLIEDVVPV